MKRLADYQKAVNDHRVIYLDGRVDEEMLKSLRKQISELKPDINELAVVLRTGGGASGPGFAIVQELRALASAHEVWLLGQSMVESFGLYIMMAVKQDHRLAFPFTTFYGHWSRMSMKVDMSGWSREISYVLKERRADIKTFKREQRMMIRLLARGTNMSRKHVKRLYKNPCNLTPKQAKKLGLIGGILK